MWLTIADYGPADEQTCEIEGCDQTAAYIKEDRFNRKVCGTCRTWRERWGFWPDDEDWNG